MWIHCTVHRTIFCASHLSRLTSEFASVRFSFLVNHIVWKHKNYTSLLMNNSLVHEENRNKTQVLELIPYFHFFFLLLKAEQCSEGILMIDCLNVNYFIIFSTKKLRNTFILHHGLVPQCHTAYLWHIFWKIKFQQFLWQHKESTLS